MKILKAEYDKLPDDKKQAGVQGQTNSSANSEAGI